MKNTSLDKKQMFKFVATVAIILAIGFVAAIYLAAKAYSMEDFQNLASEVQTQLVRMVGK